MFSRYNTAPEKNRIPRGVPFMLRQLTNLWHYGRIRTNAPTARTGKPKFLQRQPNLEILNLLQFVLADYGKTDDFFFVQIGAFDGVTADPIYEFVRSQNWHGVLVEPQVEAFERLHENYAGQDGLQFFNVAICAHDGKIELFTRPDGMVQAASLERHLMKKPGRRGRQVVARCVVAWTFATLLEKAAAPSQIDLLQIDAEGMDYQIIRSIDFQRIKPAIIRYEHMVLHERDRDACLELLAGQGYRFLLEDSDTTAYLGRSPSVPAG